MLRNLSTHQEFKFGWIGGAASTLINIAYVLRGIKNNPEFQTIPIHLSVFDKAGLNVGPAYRLRHPGFILNQPAGQEMDAFHDAGPGLPMSFLNWLNSSSYRATSRQDFTDKSFIARAAYGDYLLYVKDWIHDELVELPNVTLREIRQHILSVDRLPSRDQQNVYALRTENGATFESHGFVIATGHSYTPKMDTPHPLYVPSYVGHDFESRLAAISQSPDEKIVIGSGASMADVVCAMEAMGNKSRYRVVSPYGNTRWPYETKAVRPEESILQAYIHAFVTNPFTQRNKPKALRQLLTTTEEQIAPQYILSALLKNNQVQEDSALLSVVKAFYGNPLSPQRFNQLNKIEDDKRLIYVSERVHGLASEGSLLKLTFDNAQTEVISHPVIDCSLVNRGTYNHKGQLLPLLHNLVEQDIISLSTNNLGALDACPAPGHPIFALGPITNAHKNGIETFRRDYQRVTTALLGHLESLTPTSRARFHPNPPQQLRL